MKARKAIFRRVRLVRPLDGARQATVIVSDARAVAQQSRPDVQIRLHRRRRCYSMDLAAVIDLVVYRIAQTEAAERRRKRGRR